MKGEGIYKFVGKGEGIWWVGGSFDYSVSPGPEIGKDCCVQTQECEIWT